MLIITIYCTLYKGLEINVVYWVQKKKKKKKNGDILA